jgi:hypothetical protein
VVMGGDTVADPAAVVAPGGLLDPLKHQNVRVVDAGQEVPGPGVVVAIELQDFALKIRKVI